jgi:hypothetical protein
LSERAGLILRRVSGRTDLLLLKEVGDLAKVQSDCDRQHRAAYDGQENVKGDQPLETA